MITRKRSILKQYILPSIGGMIGTSLYVLGDTLLVGRKLGQEGLAALNIAIPLINVLTGFGLLVGVGGASLMVIKRAQHQKQASDQLFTKSMVLALFIGVLLLVLSLFYTKPLIALLGKGSHHMDMAYAYLSMLLLFSPFYLLFVSLGVFVRNDGNVK